MKAQIESELRIIVGQPLTFTRRIVDFQAFEFGPQLPTISRNGQPMTKADYVLHVQCPWRIIRNGAVFVGSEDSYARVPEDTDLSELDIDQHEASRRDFFMSQMRLDLVKNERYVEGVTADELGGIKITLSNGDILDLFPCNTDDQDAWRLMIPDRCIVLSGEGLYTMP